MKKHGPSFRKQRIDLAKCPACRGAVVIKGVFHEMACVQCNASGWVEALTGNALPLDELVTQLNFKLQAAQRQINELRGFQMSEMQGFPDLAALKAVAMAATQGPWERADCSEVCVSECGDEAFWSWEQAGPAQFHGSGRQPIADADFVAAASPEVVLALIAEIERLKGDQS